MLDFHFSLYNEILFYLMQSPFVEYELNISRNPFKLNTKQKQLKLNKCSNVQFLSDNNKILLYNSTPKLRLLFNPQLSKQSHFSITTDAQTQKFNLLQFKSHKKQPQNNFQQKLSDYECSLVRQKNCQSLRSSSTVKKGYSSEILSHLSRQKLRDSSAGFARIKLMGKKQKQIKKVSSIKGLSIFKTQKSQKLSSSKAIRKGTQEMVLKPLKRKGKYGLRSQSVKIFSINLKSTRFEYQLDKQLASDEDSFTFGKPSCTKRI